MINQIPAEQRLAAIGWRQQWQAKHEPMRIVSVSRTTWVLWGKIGERIGRIAGQLRHQSQTHELPVTGDWVDFIDRGEGRHGIIQSVLPRHTLLQRKSYRNEIQVLCANVDTALIVVPLNQSFNSTLLERWLALAISANINAIIVLSKADLITSPGSFIATVQTLTEAPVYAIDTRSTEQCATISTQFKAGDTLVALGPSGAGKSTLSNSLIGKYLQATSDTRKKDDKGRHTTVSRRLLLCGSVAIIDTPGLKSLRPDINAADLATLFPELAALASQCRYRNCRHNGEPSCAIAEALADGRLEPRRWQSFQAIQTGIKND